MRRWLCLILRYFYLQCRIHSILISRRHPFRASLEWRKRYLGRQASKPASSVQPASITGTGCATTPFDWLAENRTSCQTYSIIHQGQGQALLVPEDCPQGARRKKAVMYPLS